MRDGTRHTYEVTVELTLDPSVATTPPVTGRPASPFPAYGALTDRLRIMRLDTAAVAVAQVYTVGNSSSISYPNGFDAELKGYFEAYSSPEAVVQAFTELDELELLVDRVRVEAERVR